MKNLTTIKLLYNLIYPIDLIVWRVHGGLIIKNVQYIYNTSQSSKRKNQDEAFIIISSPGCHKIAEEIYAMNPFSIPRYKENLRQATGKSYI